MEKLTEREKQTLELLMKGLTNKEISKIMEVTVHTIKVFLSSIYKKLGVINRVQAVIKYLEFEVKELKINK